MNPEIPRQPPGAVEQPKKRKETSKLKRATAIAFGLFGGGVAISSDAAMEDPRQNDLGVAVDPRPVPETPTENPKFLRTKTPDGEPGKEPAPRVSAGKPKMEEAAPPLPETLQNQIDQIQNLCQEYLYADPMQILDPLRPPILKELTTRYKEFLDNPERGEHEQAKYQLLSDLCGDSKTFSHRGLELARMVETLPMSPFERQIVLQQLRSHNSVYGFGAFEVDEYAPTWEKVMNEGNLPTQDLEDIDPASEEAQTIADAKKFYHKAFDALSHPETLTPEERYHLGRSLMLGKSDDNRFDFFSEAERTKVQLLIRDYVELPDLARDYKKFIENMDNPPANQSDTYAFHRWRAEHSANLSGILRQMENYGIDPADIGSNYSWEELDEMLEELRALSRESQPYLHPFEPKKD